MPSDETWEKVWTKDLITSDYSLKYIEHMGNVAKDLPDGSKVLEAGCGTGQTLALFSSHHETVGFDISPAALEIAKKNCTHPVLGSIFSMPFPDNTFDLVYNSGVIEHFREPTNIHAIREMARITKPSGKVIIIVPNSMCLWYRIGKFIAVLMKNFEFGYEEDYSPTRLQKAAERAGLSIEDVFGLQVSPPFATNSNELLSIHWRKKFGAMERVFPKKQYYAYTVGIVAKKTS